MNIPMSDTLAIKYYKKCVRLKEIKNELEQLYDFNDESWRSEVLSDIDRLFKRKKEASIWDYSEWYARDCPSSFYTDEIKTDFDVISKCFQLYSERKSLKAEKWKITRLLYLQWMSEFCKKK